MRMNVHDGQPPAATPATVAGVFFLGGRAVNPYSYRKLPQAEREERMEAIRLSNFNTNDEIAKQADLQRYCVSWYLVHAWYLVHISYPGISGHGWYLVHVLYIRIVPSTTSP